MTSLKAAESGLFWNKGRGRGFRPAGSLSPSRRPGVPAPSSGTAQNVFSTGIDSSSKLATNGTNQHPKNPAPGQSNISAFDGCCKPDAQFTAVHYVANANTSESRKKLMAKYNYKANTNSPLGSELNLTQGQHVFLVNKHPENEQWWKVEDTQGSVGFVPAKYVITVEGKPTQLPWLLNKEIEDAKNYDVHAKPVFKPYVSAYNRTETQPSSTTKDISEYYCSVCAKQLNGPQPYAAHMTSKAHKEEVELAKEYEAEGIPRD